MSEFPAMTFSPARAEAFFETMNTTRPRAKRHGSAVLALAAALAVAAYIGGAAAQARSVVGGTNPTTGAASTVSPLPGRPPAFQMASPSVSEGQIGAKSNVGPVTGYGSGGLEHIPGSPPNRPYR